MIYLLAALSIVNNLFAFNLLFASNNNDKTQIYSLTQHLHEPILLFDDFEEIAGICNSDDGKSIIFIGLKDSKSKDTHDRNKQIYIYQFDTEKIICATNFNDDVICDRYDNSITVLKNNIYFIEERNNVINLCIFDLDNGKKEILHIPYDNTVVNVSGISSIGNYAICDPTSVYIYNGKNKYWYKVKKGSWDGTNILFWSKSGYNLFYRCDNANYVYNIKDEKEYPILNNIIPIDLSWFDNDTKIAFTYEEKAFTKAKLSYINLNSKNKIIYIYDGIRYFEMVNDTDVVFIKYKNNKAVTIKNIFSKKESYAVDTIFKPKYISVVKIKSLEEKK